MLPIQRLAACREQPPWMSGHACAGCRRAVWRDRQRSARVRRRRRAFRPVTPCNPCRVQISWPTATNQGIACNLVAAPTDALLCFVRVLLAFPSVRLPCRVVNGQADHQPPSWPSCNIAARNPCPNRRCHPQSHNIENRDHHSIELADHTHGPAGFLVVLCGT